MPQVTLWVTDGGQKSGEEVNVQKRLIVRARSGMEFITHTYEQEKERDPTLGWVCLQGSFLPSLALLMTSTMWCVRYPSCVSAILSESVPVRPKPAVLHDKRNQNLVYASFVAVHANSAEHRTAHLLRWLGVSAVWWAPLRRIGWVPEACEEVQRHFDLGRNVPWHIPKTRQAEKFWGRPSFCTRELERWFYWVRTCRTDLPSRAGSLRQVRQAWGRRKLLAGICFLTSFWPVLAHFHFDQ